MLRDETADLDRDQLMKASEYQANGFGFMIKTREVFEGF